MKPSSSPIPYIIAVLIVAAGVYWYISGSEDQPTLMAGEAGGQVKTQFQTLVRELTPISFTTGIFSDVRFTALVDLTTPIAPESSGRLDPFAAASNAAPPPAVAESASKKIQ